MTRINRFTLIGLAAWWALIEGLLWAAGAITGGTP